MTDDMDAALVELVRQGTRFLKKLTEWAEEAREMDKAHREDMQRPQQPNSKVR